MYPWDTNVFSSLVRCKFSNAKADEIIFAIVSLLKLDFN